MIDDLKALLDIKPDVPRVMTVTKKISENSVRVEANGQYLIIMGNYALDTQLIISAGNVVSVVATPLGTFYI
jgi:hypothetical protein